MSLTVLVVSAALAEPVVLARGDIPRGTVVSRELLYVVDVPNELVPQRTFQSVDDVVGRVVRVPLFARQIVREGHVRSPEEGKSRVGPRKRLVRVPLSEPGPFVQPGDRVDIAYLIDDELCVAVQAAEVIAGVEHLGVELEPKLDDFVAVHVEVDPGAVALLLGPIEPIVLLRHHADLSTWTGVPQCALKASE